MTSYTTKTAEFGRVIFSAPAADIANSGYVWIDTERGYAAQQRRQICYGGEFLGNTVTATTDNLKAEAQKWLRQRRNRQRREGIVI